MTTTKTTTTPHISSPSSRLPSFLPYLKFMDHMFELPIISDTYDYFAHIISPLSPYMLPPIASINTTCSTIKTLTQEKILPCLPETINMGVNNIAEKANTTITNLDTLACSNLELFVGKVPVLKQTIPEIYQTSKNNVKAKVHHLTVFMASFTISQVLLKISNTGLRSMDSLVQVTGIQDSSLPVVVIREIQSTATNIRKEGALMNGSERVKRIEKASLLGALAEVTGILSLIGFRLQKTKEEEPEEKETTY